MSDSASCMSPCQGEIWTKGSPLNSIWLVAFKKKKMTRKECAKTNVRETCNLILAETISLQIVSSLQLGLIRIHAKQTDFLERDCQSLLELSRSGIKSQPNVSCTARPDEITLPKGNFDTSFFSNHELDVSGACFDTSSMIGEELFHYSFSEYMTSLVPGSLPTTPEQMFRADEKDITLPDHQIVPETSFLDQLTEDQYFGDEIGNFVVPDDDTIVGSPPKGRLVDPADTSHDKVLLLDVDDNDGFSFYSTDKVGPAGEDSGDCCVPQLDSSTHSFATGFDLSGASPIRAVDTITGFDSTSAFVLAPLGEDDIGPTCSRFTKKRRTKKQTVFDSQLCLPEKEMNAEDIERFKNYKTRTASQFRMVRKHKTKELMNHNSTFLSYGKQSTLSRFVKKMFSDVRLSEPLTVVESPPNHPSMTSTPNQTRLTDDSLGMQGGMDSDLEQHRHAPKQGPTSFDEQSGQTSGLMGLIGFSSHLGGGDSMKNSSSLQGLSMRRQDRPLVENVGLPGVLTPILDVGSELEDDDSIGMDRCNFSDLSIELPRCDPFSTSGGALDESTVQTFSRRVDGILNQGEHVEFKDLLPGNGACSRKSAAKTFSELLGVLSSSRRHKVQQDKPYGPIVVTRVS